MKRLAGFDNWVIIIPNHFRFPYLLCGPRSYVLKLISAVFVKRSLVYSVFLALLFVTFLLYLCIYMHSNLFEFPAATISIIRIYVMVTEQRIVKLKSFAFSTEDPRENNVLRVVLFDNGSDSVSSAISYADVVKQDSPRTSPPRLISNSCWFKFHGRRT